MRTPDAESRRDVTVMEIDVRDYPPLLAIGIVAYWPGPIGELSSPQWLVTLLQAHADEAPFQSDEQVRSEIRAMMRARGYKPSGRGKPAAEYLSKAADKGDLRSINVAVDVCNVVSLHSGLPISVVDLDRTVAPLHIAAPDDGTSYVFNAAGQEIDLTGIPSLTDTLGPCANGVKDSQRTKTSDETQQTLSILWSTPSLEERTREVTAWYESILVRLSARVERVNVISEAG